MSFPVDVLVKAKNGDEKAKRMFCRWSLPIVRNLLVKIDAPSDTIEDISQDAMVRILRGLPNLKYNKAVMNFIFQCARHAWQDFLRSKYQQQKIQSLTLAEFNKLYIKQKDAQKQLALELMITESLGKMPMHLRELFFLWKIEELTTLEIAEFYDVSTYIVKKWKTQLKRRLYLDVFRDLID